MKRKFSIYTLFLVTIWISEVILLTGCKKDPVLATITTTEPSEITISSAKTGGNITANGGAEVTSRGVCWGTTTQPDILGPYTSNGKGNGIFISSLTELTPGTTYYVRAFASNVAGTAYGEEFTFKTVSLVLPILTTTDITGITSSSAVTGGNISSDGGAPVTERGVCWSTSANPTISNDKTLNGSGSGSFSANISGLNFATTYHVRAFATNSVGTAYGADIAFTTLPVSPTLSTTIPSPVTQTTAVSGGNITNNGGSPVTARGVCWSITSGPVVTGSHTTDGSGSGSFVSPIANLSPNTLYYIRAYATNSIGTSYGNELSFTTSNVLVPVLTTSQVSGVTLSAALSGGNITEDNGGNITDRGVCWNTSANPTIANFKTSDGTGTGSFTSSINGLAAGTIYYVRAFATNSAGTAYGNQFTFSTNISDIEGNAYKTLLLGTQLWTTENLKTTRYNDGTSVPLVTGAAEWSVLASDAYCWYANNESLYKDAYGALYNWFSVNKGALCPTGWHIPNDEEYKTLEKYLGMSQGQADAYGWRGTDQGTSIKSTSGWFNGGNGTNSSGFNGLPGGYRYGADGGFYDIGKLSYFWSSTQYEYDALKGTYRRIDYNMSTIFREGTSKKGGKFVRCVKN